jgi:hypothetical protein
MLGGEGNDILAGGSWELFAENTNQSTLTGGLGADTLVAIEGNVYATGDADEDDEGNDVFALYGSKENLSVNLVIEDFSAGDRIDLSKFLLDIDKDIDDLKAYLFVEGVLNTDYVYATGNDPSDLRDLRIDLSGLTDDDSQSILITIKNANSSLITPAFIDSRVITTANTQDTNWWFNQISPLVRDEVATITTVELNGNELILGSIIDDEPLNEVFVGSTGDDRVVGRGGFDIFKDFSGADIFLGGNTSKLQIAQERYLQESGTTTAYLHIEQMSATDFAASVDREITLVEGGFDPDLIGLRLVDNLVDPLTGAESNTIGFAQVEKIQIIKGGLIDDTIYVKVITDADDRMGLQLSDDRIHYFLGGLNNDVISGGLLKDVIVGNGGSSDWILGGAGNDILAGG